MDIKNVKNLNPYTNRKVQEGNKPGSADKGSQAKSSATSSGDTVSLSGDAKLMGTALAEAAKASDVRQDKIRDLKERVKNGTYKPDLKKAAANLLRDELQLTGK